MPFEDFKRPWKILESTVSCRPEKIVHIEGEEDAVIVLCGTEPYAPAKYLDRDLEKGKEQRIEKEVEKQIVYEIFFIEKNPKNGRARIRAAFGEGQIGGSWTAEDNTGGIETG